MRNINGHLGACKKLSQFFENLVNQISTDFQVFVDFIGQKQKSRNRPRLNSSVENKKGLKNPQKTLKSFFLNWY